MVRRLTLSAAALAVLVPAWSVAQAAGETPPGGRRVPYVYVTAGKVLPWGDAMKDFGGGLAVEGGVGVEIVPHVAVEAGAGHFTMGHHIWAPVLGIDVVDELSATPLVAALRVFGRTANAEYFVTAGLGYYWMSFEQKVGGPSFSYDESAGAHLGAGIVSYLSPRVTLGATGRYTKVKATFFGTTLHVDSIVVSGTIGYRF